MNFWYDMPAAAARAFTAASRGSGNRRFTCRDFGANSKLCRVIPERS